ncbi:MAG: hypothetical protein LBT98_03720 [Puniceicoccales bacterium]|nr:hypothetical protein [Puniceicoccales bacterium]
MRLTMEKFKNFLMNDGKSPTTSFHNWSCIKNVLQDGISGKYDRSHLPYNPS